MRRVAIISSQAFSLGNFRGPLIRELVARGVQVFALAPDYVPQTRDAVAALGAQPVAYRLQRAGLRPLRDVIDTLRLLALLRRLRPDATLAYFVKPVIYGGLAARMARVPQRYALIEGAGYVFADHAAQSWYRRVLRAAVSGMYRLALQGARRVFVLNQEDGRLFLDHGLVRAVQLVCLGGIGVDLDEFAAAPPVTAPVTFVLVARLLREKGVGEYVAAARLVRAVYPRSRMLLVGGVDENPGALTNQQVQAWVDEGVVEWTGPVPDVRPWLRQASVCVLPSFYREGVPRSLQEAMAMGRPLITTDWVGCRDTVEPGRNGFLVPVRDVAALAAAMRRFVEQPELIVSMGAASRRLAEQRFDARRVNARMLDAMGV
jgi:glycosyltransferase involved in cell wall biosynthesis